MSLLSHAACTIAIVLRLILVVVSTVAIPGEWQCKIRIGGVQRLAVANGPNIFQMLLVKKEITVSSDILDRWPRRSKNKRVFLKMNKKHFDDVRIN